MAISRGRLHASAVDSNYSGRPLDGDFTNGPGELTKANYCREFSMRGISHATTTIFKRTSQAVGFSFKEGIQQKRCITILNTGSHAGIDGML